MKLMIAGIGLTTLMVVAGSVWFSQDKEPAVDRPVPQAEPEVYADSRLAAVAEEAVPADRVSLPAQAAERVTKKPFGILIDPKTSPVQPERFRGYHTGIDFETFSDEADIDVPVHAICTGPLLAKRMATGYGGVVVQSCTLDGQHATVVYGHVRLASIEASVGDTLKEGDMLGVLGMGYSEETDDERKHLHLGIHRGTAVNIRGYVASKQELDQWIDPCRFVCGNSNL